MVAVDFVGTKTKFEPYSNLNQLNVTEIRSITVIIITGPQIFFEILKEETSNSAYPVSYFSGEFPSFPFLSKFYSFFEVFNLIN